MDTSQVKIFIVVKDKSPDKISFRIFEKVLETSPCEVTIEDLQHYDLDRYISMLSAEQWDIFAIPLSLPNYGSLKIAEFIHLTNSQTRLALVSGTHAPSNLLLNIFDYYTPSLFEILHKFPTILEIPVKRIQSRETLDGFIAALLATATGFDHRMGHGSHPSKLDDYRESFKEQPAKVNLPQINEEGKKVKGALSVFFSYAHADEAFRQELEQHLTLLRRQGHIKIWHDRKITAGDEWKGEIDTNLCEADVILLLISSAFIASDYCYDIEMQLAVQRHEDGTARVIPIIIRPTDWNSAPFAKIQALPKDAKPVTTWTNKDEAWLDVTSGIRRAIKEMRGV